MSQVILEMNYGEAGYVDAPPLRAGRAALSRASRNLIPLGDGVLRVFKGTEFVGQGARRMFPFRDGWAGLGDVLNGGVITKGSGSVFASLFAMCVFAGNGQLSINGMEIPGEIATSLVRILLFWNGSYTAPESGSYIAGLPEPSAPIVGVLNTTSSVVPNVTGATSFKLAGYRTTTGGRSRASATSAVVVPAGKPITMQFPLPAVGLTNWAIFATDDGAGGRGTHRRMTRPNPYTQAEFLESDIQRAASTSFTGGSNTITSTTANFTPADIGKRVEISGAGISIPFPTTITQVLSPTVAKMSGNASASGTRSTSFLAFVGGVDRTVLLNYAQGDLAAEFAWIDDFAPPPVSHVGELEKVWIYFTGGGANDGVASANGSIAQFSNKNYLESVNPFWRLFLPAPVVDILPRGIDGYMFIGLKTMIIVFQYIESFETAPATASVALQNEGIASPNNWCLRFRGLYIFSSNGTFIRIIQGGDVDSSFSKDITPYTRLWIQKDVVVGNHRDGKSVILAYGGITLMFSEETEKWSSRLYLNDYEQGKAIACVTTESELLLTMEKPGLISEPGEIVLASHRSVKFDKGNTTNIAVAVSDYQTGGDPRFPKTLDEIYASLVSDSPGTRAFVSIHRNYEPQFFTDASITAGKNVLTVPSAKFTGDHLGYYVLIRNAGGTPNWMRARITAVTSPTTATLGDCKEILAECIPFNSVGGASKEYCLFAYEIYETAITRKGVTELVAQRIELANCFSFAVGIAFQATGDEDAMPLNSSLSGFLESNFGSEMLP